MSAFNGTFPIPNLVTTPGVVAAPTLRVLEPQANGANYSEFKAQAQAANVTYTLPASDGTVSGQVFSTNAAGTLSWASPGKVLQAVQGTTSSVQNTSSSADADTSLTATITPTSSSSRILVLVSQAGFQSYDVSGGNNPSTVWGTLKLYRGGSQIVLLSDAAGNVGCTTVSAAYIDSPATTSATTYKTTYSTGGSPAVGDRTRVQYKSALSMIVLLEIAA